MESRWYLSPGQSLENTKIEDRGHALHITRRSWSKITAHLDRNRLIQEAIEKEHAHRQALKEGSEAMTKDWDNSVENIRKRKEEERQLRLEKEQEERMESFFQLRKEQEAIRKKFIEDERKAIFLSKGHPKNLSSALIESEVLFEREKQRELEEKIKAHEREVAAKYAQKVREGVEEEKLEKLEKEKKIVEKKLELREIYLKAMKDKEEQDQAEREARIAKESLDNINAEKEIERIKQFEREEVQATKAAIKSEFKQFYEKQERAKKQLEQEEKEQELVIDIYSQAKHRIECLRRKKGQEMQEAMQKRREAAAKQIIAEAGAKTVEEERILKKAMKDRELEELEKLKAKEAVRQQLIQDRAEDRRRFLEREEKRKFKEEEWEKWQMLNRFKRNDIMKQYEQDKKEKEWGKVLGYRRELFEQMAEDEGVRKKEKEESDTLFECSKQKLIDEDNQFFKYADEVYDKAKSRGRTTVPIERVILEYKKENNLPLTVYKPCKDYKKSN